MTKSAIPNPANLMCSNNVVIYARVSSEEQAQTGYSIPSQLSLLIEYAQRKGLTVVKEFVDVETAKRTGRVQFGEMLKFLAEPGENCRTVLVEKTDRLYRNLKDYVTLSEIDAEVHLVKEGEILSRDSHSSQKMIHGIKVVLAKHYIDNLSEETSKGLREKAEEGIWPSAAPFGYRNTTGPAGKKYIEPDPNDAPLITQLYEWYATGDYSLKELCVKARAAGMVYRRSKLPIQKALVHKILRSRLYMGEFEYKKKTYQGSHLPLVSRELWQKVQDQLDNRFAHRHRKIKHSFAYSRLIRCGHCGSALVGEIQKSRYIYYHCSNPNTKCKEPFVREEKLSKCFDKVVQSIQLPPDVLEWVVGALRSSHQDEKQFHDESIARLQAEYSRIQGRLDAMYLDKLEGRIDNTFYDRKAAEWRQDQRRTMEEVRNHETANRNYLDAGIRVLELSTRATELFEEQPALEKRRLLKFMISNCTWRDGELTVNYRQPFDLIADANRTKKAQPVEIGVELAETEIWGE